MPRFVVLEHDHPHLHWDFMLEAGATLRTWRLAAPPETNRTIAAEPLGEHRLAYLDYEGPISGSRGSVRRWDAGEFDWLENQAAAVRVALRGRRCHGPAKLRGAEDGTWSFCLED